MGIWVWHLHLILWYLHLEQSIPNHERIWEEVVSDVICRYYWRLWCVGRWRFLPTIARAQSQTARRQINSTHGPPTWILSAVSQILRQRDVSHMLNSIKRQLTQRDIPNSGDPFYYGRFEKPTKPRLSTVYLYRHAHQSSCLYPE